MGRGFLRLGGACRGDLPPSPNRNPGGGGKSPSEKITKNCYNLLENIAILINKTHFFL